MNSNEKNLDNFKHMQTLVLRNFRNLILCLSIIVSIYTRLNFLAANSVYRSEIHSVLKSYYIQNVFDRNLEFLFESIGNIVPNSELIASRWSLITVQESRNDKWVKKQQQCFPDRELPFGNTFNSSRQRCLKTLTAKINRLLESRRCGPVKELSDKTSFENVLNYISRSETNNFEFQVSDPSKVEPILKCILDNYDFETIHLEFNLFNPKLKHLIYVHFFIPKSKKYELDLNVIDLDRSFLAPNYFTLDFIPTLLILSAFVVLLATMLVKKNSLGIDYTNLVDLLLVYLIGRLIYLELRSDWELEKVGSLFTDKYTSWRNLSDMTASRDFTLGVVSFLACIKSISYITFNQITSQILITFEQCKWDLVGFFVVFVGLLVSYTIELEHMLGGHMDSFSNTTRSLAALFSFIWGEVDFESMLDCDWKSLVVLASYLVVMIIYMFNLMLAIILGTYDRVRVDPKYKRLHLKLGDYLVKLVDRFINRGGNLYEPTTSLWAKFRTLIARKANPRLYCVQDLESTLIKHGFQREEICGQLSRLGVGRGSQVENSVVESVVEGIFEAQFESKPKLKEEIVSEYVSEVEWKKLVIKHDSLERFSSLLERRLDTIYELGNFEKL